MEIFCSEKGKILDISIAERIFNYSDNCLDCLICQCGVAKALGGDKVNISVIDLRDDDCCTCQECNGRILCSGLRISQLEKKGVT